MAVDPDPTAWTDEQREYFAAGWNECLKMQPSAQRPVGICAACGKPAIGRCEATASIYHRES